VFYLKEVGSDCGPLQTMLSGYQSFDGRDGILLEMYPTGYHQMQIDQNVTQVRFETVHSTVCACVTSRHALYAACAYLCTLTYACMYIRSIVLVRIHGNNMTI
jgi:hypothetical protein